MARADADNIRCFGPDAEGACTDARSALSYRHDWGEIETSAKLFLEWDSVTAKSRVFVSLTEGAVEGADPGSVRCSLSDVVPRDGGVSIRVHVEGGRPVPITANYLVIGA